MADLYFLIPRDGEVTEKIKADEDQLQTMTDFNSVRNSLTTRKGHLTRMAKQVKRDSDYNDRFKMSGKATFDRYVATRDALIDRYEMTLNGYRRLLQLTPLQQETIFREYEESYEIYWNSRDVIDVLCGIANPFPKEEENRRNQEQNQAPQQPERVADWAKTLKPPTLTESSLPANFKEFFERLKIYFTANRVDRATPAEQREVLRQYISKNLYDSIRNDITPEMEVFMDINDDRYEEDHMNCVMDLLEREFRTLQPTSNRRLAVFRKKQRAEQSGSSFAAEVIRDAEAANLRDLNEEDLCALIIINGLRNESDVQDILKQFKPEDDLDLHVIQEGLKTLEKTKRTAKSMSGNQSEIFKMSNYKKNQRAQRQSYARANYFCGECKTSGHTNDRCPKKGNERQSRSKSRNGRGRGSQPSRGRGRGRPSYPTNRRYRSQSRSNRSKSRGRSGSRGNSRKQSHFKSMTSSTNSEERSQVASAATPSLNTQGKNVNYFNALTSEQNVFQNKDDQGREVNFCQIMDSKVESEIVPGFKHSLPTPRVPVHVRPTNSNPDYDASHFFKANPDSGATRSVLSHSLAKYWNVKFEDASDEVLYNASLASMQLSGKCYLDVTYRNTTVRVHCLITPEIQRRDLYLSWHDLHLLKALNFDFNEDSFFNYLSEMTDKKSIYEQILAEFGDVVSDQLPKKPLKAPPMEIHVDESKMPKNCPYVAPRSRPAAYDEKAKLDLQQMEEDGVIEKPKVPPRLLHPGMWVLKPNGDLRFIVDFSKYINPAVIRKIQPFEPAWNLIRKLQPTSKYYAVCDLKCGYFQALIDEKFRGLTGFVVKEGTYVFRRAPMGLVSSGDHFISVTQELLKDLPGVTQLVDDCLIEADSLAELHDRLRQFLTRCRANNIGISRKKLQIGPKVTFGGYVIDNGKVRMDPGKLSALANFPAPKDRCNLKSFLGLLAQFQNFYEDISKVRQPLNELLKKDVPYVWNEITEKAFQECKQLCLTDKRVIRPLDPNLHVYIYTDSSTLGHGWAVMQFPPDNDGPVILGCGSRSLHKSELNYSVTDLEFTGACYGIEKAAYWLFGRRFTLVVDHSAVVGLMTKPINQLVSPRHVRRREKLARFIFDTKHQKGSDHVVPDTFSRNPEKQPDRDDVKDLVTCYSSANICNTLASATPKYLEELVEEAKNDQQYAEVVKMIREGFPQKQLKTLHSNHPAKTLCAEWDDLGVIGDLLTYQGSRLVIPRACRKQILEKLHLPHQAYVRTYKNAKELYFWKSLSRDVKNLTESCEDCIRFHSKMPSEPMNPVQSLGPMDLVHADPFYLDGKNYLAVKCGFTSWIWCYKLKDLSSESVIRIFTDIMDQYGKFARLATDNATCFTSDRFRTWAEGQGINYDTSSPGHPAGNGNSENAVREAKRLLKKVNSNWETFRIALREYNNTPRASDGVSAAELMYGRRLRTELPAVPSHFTFEDAPIGTFDKTKKRVTFLNMMTGDDSDDGEKLIIDDDDYNYDQWMNYNPNIPYHMQGGNTQAYTETVHQDEKRIKIDPIRPTPQKIVTVQYPTPQYPPPSSTVTSGELERQQNSASDMQPSGAFHRYAANDTSIPLARLKSGRYPRKVILEKRENENPQNQEQLQVEVDPYSYLRDANQSTQEMNWNPHQPAYVHPSEIGSELNPKYVLDNNGEEVYERNLKTNPPSTIQYVSSQRGLHNCYAYCWAPKHTKAFRRAVVSSRYLHISKGYRAKHKKRFRKLKVGMRCLTNTGSGNYDKMGKITGFLPHEDKRLTNTRTDKTRCHTVLLDVEGQPVKRAVEHVIPIRSLDKHARKHNVVFNVNGEPFELSALDQEINDPNFVFTMVNIDNDRAKRFERDVQTDTDSYSEMSENDSRTYAEIQGIIEKEKNKDKKAKRKTPQMQYQKNKAEIFKVKKYTKKSRANLIRQNAFENPESASHSQADEQGQKEVEIIKEKIFLRNEIPEVKNYEADFSEYDISESEFDDCLDIFRSKTPNLDLENQKFESQTVNFENELQPHNLQKFAEISGGLSADCAESDAYLEKSRESSLHSSTTTTAASVAAGESAQQPPMKASAAACASEPCKSSLKVTIKINSSGKGEIIATKK